MHKTPRFFVHQKADEDLEVIFDYSLEKFGFARTARYIKDIEIMFEKLACNPQKGNTFDIQLPNCLHLKVESHFIYYAEYQGGIEIFRVLHKRMEPTRHLIDILDQD
tara:strand:+ start:204 stop:524 length:321 start_codon:yes stop_codon:yes gene_type:complete